MDMDVFVKSESIAETQIPLVFSSATRVWVYNGFLACLVVYAHAVVVRQGAIEGISRFRASSHVVDRDVVAKERHGLFVGKTYDLKGGHSSQGFGHQRRRRR